MTKVNSEGHEFQLDPQAVDPVRAYFDPHSEQIVRPNLEATAVDLVSQAPDDFMVAEVTTGTSVRQRIAFFPNDVSVWSTAQMRDYEALMDRIVQMTLSRNLVLKDGHPFNVVFEGPFPRFVDLGSFQNHGTWDHFSHERRTYRRVTTPYLWATCLPLRNTLANRYHPRRIQTIRAVMKSMFGRDPVVPPKERAARFLRQNAVRRMSSWSHYASDIETFDGGEKEVILRQLLADLAPSTLVDIGCNIGGYSVLGARMGAKVLALDVDDVAISYLQSFAGHEDLDITCVVADLPLYQTVTERTPPVLRPGSIDMVLCYAILHHLVHAEKLDFYAFFDLVNKFSPKNLLVEFVSYEDVHVREWKPRREWYSLDVLIEVSRQYGYEHDAHPPHHPGRSMVHFKRNNPAIR